MQVDCLVLSTRKVLGRNASKKLRKNGIVPVSVQHEEVCINASVDLAILSKKLNSSLVTSISLDKKELNARIVQVSRHPVSGEILSANIKVTDA